MRKSGIFLENPEGLATLVDTFLGNKNDTGFLLRVYNRENLLNDHNDSDRCRSFQLLKRVFLVNNDLFEH